MQPAGDCVKVLPVSRVSIGAHAPPPLALLQDTASLPVTGSMTDDKLDNTLFQDALEALVKFGKGLVNFLIWLGLYVLPIVLVIGLPIFFLVRWLMRRSKARKQTAASGWKTGTDGEGLPPLPTEKK
mgnify:CR=1 FL=1